MYKLRISAKAKRRLAHISIHHQTAILEAFHEIQDDPFMGKPLSRQLTGRFSFRVGVYRIIYKIREFDRIVEILSAGHRSVVYQ